MQPGSSLDSESFSQSLVLRRHHGVEVYEAHPPTLLFPQEFGWVDGERSQRWKGGRCNAKQRHR
jgi:hypothetical protein